MKKIEIPKELADIIEDSYSKGFSDALYLAKKWDFEIAKQSLDEGIKTTRKMFKIKKI